MSTTLDSIIIGAGFSGLSAARKLTQNAYNVLIIEARDRTGGRAQTHTQPGIPPVDLGCSWIHGYAEGTPVKKLVEELNIPAQIPKPKETLLCGPSGPLSSTLSSKLFANLRKASDRSKETSLLTTSQDTPVSSSIFDASSLLFEGLETIEEKRLAVALSRSMQVGMGATLEEKSLQWHGYEDSYAGTDAAPKGGYQSVTTALETEIAQSGSHIHLNETVTSIELTSSSTISITTSTPSGVPQTYTALTCINTLPLGVLQHLDLSTFFTPSLGARKEAAIKRTHVGMLGKVLLTYETAWWLDQENIGTFMIFPTKETEATWKPEGNESARELLESVTLVVASFASGALPDSTHPTLLTYIPAPIAATIEGMPSSVVADALHVILADRFPFQKPPTLPTHFAVTSWSVDPFARGATSTSSLVGEGRSPLDFLELGKPAWGGRLGFAGEHTDVNHRGSVAGAVVSGFREGERVGDLLGRLKG